MIYKEPDRLNTDDRYLKAGYAAEKQMAYYLHHAFGGCDKFQVLNGIRLQKKEDICQIDHLIIHEYGMIIVESKSVTSKLKINNDGSWERLWDNHYEGMRSPVIQAKMQAEFLENYLNDYKEQLFNKKILGIQFSFDKMPIEILVAISDKGRIERSEHPENKYVFKADQIPIRIKELYDAEKKKDSALSLKIPWTIGENAIKRIIDFLKENHKTVQVDKNQENQTAKIDEVEKPELSSAEYSIKMQTSTCPDCGKQMEIRWGEKYKSYYWKCKTCDKNVSTYEKCPQCSEKLKIRKKLHQYFVYCEKCKIEGLYHEQI